MNQLFTFLQICILSVATIQCSTKRAPDAALLKTSAAMPASLASPPRGTSEGAKEQRAQKIMETAPQGLTIPIKEKSLVIRVERLGELDLLNIRRGGQLGAVTISIDTYEYHKESEIKGAPATSALIQIDQTKFITYNKELLIDLPMYFAERKLIDIEIPPALDITVIVDTEIRHQGVIEEAKAWRGLEKIPGVTDHLAARTLTLAVKTLHLTFGLPLSQYPLVGAQSIKVVKKQALASPFRGLQSIFLQVDLVTRRPLTAL